LVAGYYVLNQYNSSKKGRKRRMEANHNRWNV
jgi:hypothetical protein